MRFLLHHVGFRFLDGAARLVDLRLRLFQRGRDVLGIHAGDNLSGLDDIPFVREQLGDAAGIFGIDIDLVGLKPAVTVDNTRS